MMLLAMFMEVGHAAAEIKQEKGLHRREQFKQQLHRSFDNVNTHKMMSL
jgi:hypothetical protein